MISNINGPAASAGMRVDGRSSAAGARLEISQAASGADYANGASRQPGVSENFKSAILARAERFQKFSQDGGQSPEAALALADSVSQAALTVREIYGQDAANAFMAGVLKGVDQKGFNQETLTESVSLAVRDMAQAGNKKQLADLAEAFNQDLGLSAEDAADGRAVKSFSRAVADFFGLENQETAKGLVGQGLTADGHWGEVAAADAEEDGKLFITGTPEAATLALESSAAFSLEAVGEETVNELAAFLRDELGAEDAAAFLESLDGQSDFLTAMDTVINQALQQSRDPAAAAKLEAYLNGNVKNAVNASSQLNQNLFGQVEFEGWTFSQTTGDDGAPGETAYEAKWRYLNRDDVTYTRTGQSKAAAAKDDEEKSTEEKVAAAAEEDGAPTLGDLIKKISGQGQKTGELVDTQA